MRNACATMPWLAAFLSLSAAPLFGQALKGTVLGTVTDTTRAVVPNVSINITEVNTDYHRVEVTNGSGFFAFANLDPGTYRIDVAQPGFEKLVRTDIVLDANTTVRADLELTTGQLTTVVDVTAATPQLQTDRGDTGQTIDSQQLTMPMLNQRNYQNEIVLLPGAAEAYRSHSPFFNSQETLESTVNGLEHLNNFLIEGLDNNLEGTLTFIVLPADAIEAVDISTTAYDPEIGRAGAAAVNVIMKSGGNQFHGSLFEYHNDSDLQSRNVFALSVPHGVHNQFGGSAGSHIIRDKLFFFADFQGTRDLVGQTAIPTIPTAAMRTGDFTASPTVIYDPMTGNTATGGNRTPFPNQIIPANRISPIFEEYMSVLPEPTLPGLSNNIQVNTDQTKTIEGFDFKIDYVISSTDRIFVRYSFSHDNLLNPGLYGPSNGIYGGPSNSAYDATGSSLNQSPGINYNHIFSPTLIMELRAGIVRNRNNANNIDQGMNLSQKFGIPNSNLGTQWTEGLAEVYVGGYDEPMIGVSGCLPWRRASTNYEVANNWNKTLGNHLIKWGFDGRLEEYFLLQTATFSPRGRFTFAPGPTTDNASGIANGFANDLASFELDEPNGIGRDLNTIEPTRRQQMYALYLQDKWQATKKLTLDLGARWEYWPASYPQFPAGASNYDPNNNTLLLAGLGNTPLDLGIKNYPRNIYPRVGVAYRIDDKTVIRGGFGMSSFYRYINGYPWQYPVEQNQQEVAANSYVAAGSMAQGFPALVPVTIPSNGIITNPPNSNYTIFPPKTPVPYIESWNVTVQRALPGNLALDVGFVGNHAVASAGGGVSTGININAATTYNTGAASEPENILFGRTANTYYPWYTGSHYDALQTRLSHRFSKGFQTTASYAWGHSIDYAPYNVLGFATYKGSSTLNRKNLWTYSALYELPFGAGKKYVNSGVGKALLGGWQASGIWSWESGLPLLFSASSTSLNAPGNSQFPEQIAPVKILGGVGPSTYWFTPTSFANPAAGTIGNVGRDILYGPNIFSINASMSRRFNLAERFKLEFRAEAFNLTNTKVPDNPDVTLGDANFGRITTSNYGGAGGSDSAQAVNANRLYQGSLRLTF